MIEFSRYYIDLLTDVFTNIYQFFKSLFEAFYRLLILDIGNYFRAMVSSTQFFTFFDWIAFVLVTILNLLFAFFLFWKLGQLARKYLVFRKREVEKEKLLEEITSLNQKTLELIDEKNKIMAMKVSQLGAGGRGLLSQDGTDSDSKLTGATQSRFVKLIEVDREYESVVTSLVMPAKDMLSLAQLVDRFINYSASRLKLYYSRQTIALFFSALATSKVIILEGISGTGKTSLPYAMGKFFKHDTSIVSVQPSWRDKAEIIGFLNEFTKRFNETDFLKALYEASYREDLSFIVLDEMNLARIEYYFAEFLSILELPNSEEWRIDLVPSRQPGDPKKLESGKVMVPQNLWFIGTANKDDSTFTITDKVYDRAVSIEINTRSKYIDAPYTEDMTITYEYLQSLFHQARAQHPLTLDAVNNLMKLDVFIQDNFKIAFGNRIMKQIRDFVPIYVACGNSENDAVDFMLRSKILRKFETLNLAFLKDEIDKLIALITKIYGKNEFKVSIEYLRYLQKMS